MIHGWSMLHSYWAPTLTCVLLVDTDFQMGWSAFSNYRVRGGYFEGAFLCRLGCFNPEPPFYSHLLQPGTARALEDTPLPSLCLVTGALLKAEGTPPPPPRDPAQGPFVPFSTPWTSRLGRPEKNAPSIVVGWWSEKKRQMGGSSDEEHPPDSCFNSIWNFLSPSAPPSSLYICIKKNVRIPRQVSQPGLVHPALWRGGGAGVKVRPRWRSLRPSTDAPSSAPTSPSWTSWPPPGAQGNFKV